MVASLQAVENDSYLSDVFLNIFKILNEEVTAIDTSGGTVDLVEHDPGKYWVGAFPDNYIRTSGKKDEGEPLDQGDFPLGIVKTPNTSNVRRGFRLSEEFYTFEIHAYGARAEHPALIISKAWDALKRYEDELGEQNLYSLNHGQTTNDMTMRGEIKVHEMILPVTIRRLRCD